MARRYGLQESQGRHLRKESLQEPRPCDIPIKVRMQTRYPTFGRIHARQVQTLRKGMRGPWWEATRKCGEVGRILPDTELRSAEKSDRSAPVGDFERVV